MIRLQQQLVDFCQVKTMGIVNVTPDSFALHCATMDEVGVLAVCERLLQEGADWLDVGACSTRPGGQVVTEAEEKRRLDIALGAIRRCYPNQVVSVDTFRASIAEYVVKQYGVDVINDVSGLNDENMVEVLSRTRVPYILTCPGEPGTKMFHFFVTALNRLRQAGVADVIIDPGLGFNKTLAQNFQCLKELSVLKKLGCPLLVGLSRKSMIYKSLDCSPQEALNGTTAAHMLALMGGADILRVHDIKAAKQAITIWNNYGI